MATRLSPKKTGISAITGKILTIRHATESDLIRIEETLSSGRIKGINPAEYQFVVAAENRDIVGFGGLRIMSPAQDDACIMVHEKRRNRGIRTMIVRHLIEYASTRRVYAPPELGSSFKELGFHAARTASSSLTAASCRGSGRYGSSLVAYEKA